MYRSCSTASTCSWPACSIHPPTSTAASNPNNTWAQIKKNCGSRRRRGLAGVDVAYFAAIMPENRRWTKFEHEKEAAEAVVTSFPEVSLHEMRDAPDVDLLHRDGFHVGLEIVRTADERELSLRRRLLATTELIKRELARHGVQGVFWLYYDIQEMSDHADKKVWDRTVPKNLAYLLKERGAGNVESAVLVAHGITCIARIEAKEARGISVGCGWRTITAQGNTLAEIALARKHQKLARYRLKNGDRFRQYWLGIASIGPGTVEDGGFSMLLDRRYRTDYDRILLLIHASNGHLVGAQDVTPKRSE